MGLLDRFKKKQNEMNDEENKRKECRESMARLNRRAIEYAKDFKLSFDNSPQTISFLEKILEVYHRNLERDSPTENQLMAMSFYWGAYLGETLLKNGLREKGFDWDYWADSSLPNVPVLSDGNWRFMPIDKVYKRLTNGSEDSVISFYDITLDVVLSDGDLESNDNYISFSSSKK